MTLQDWPEANPHLVARNAALTQVANNAGSEFISQARAFVLKQLESGPCSGEELTDQCKAAGIAPVNGDRAFGAVFGGLSREKLIEKAGYCSRTKGHGTSGGLIWRLSK